MDLEIFIDDFNEDLICFVEFIGVERFMDICENFGGSQIYFPKKESVLRSARNKKIKAMYDGSNVRDISKKFGITKNQVENILKSK